MNKLTVKTVQEIVGSLNVEVENSFVKNQRSYFNLKCNECFNQWCVSSANIRKINGCPNCLNKLKRKTTEQFKTEVEKITEGEYELIGDYVTSKEKVRIRHNICNKTYKVKPNSFINGTRCPFCSKYKVVSEEEYRKRFSKINGIDYEVIGDYINTCTKIKIKHNCGYEYEVMPWDALRFGCAKCAGNMLKDTNQFKKEVKEVVGEEYVVLGNYVNNNTKISIQHNCNNCNNYKWKIEPKAFLRGNRCPKCNQSKGERKIEGYFIENSVDYTPQKEFFNLIGLGNGNLSYDFYLPEYNLLVEYQGEFHDGTATLQTEEQLKIQLEHDKRKRNYAKEKNIGLLEVWYWDFDNIEEILNKKIDCNGQKSRK